MEGEFSLNAGRVPREKVFRSFLAQYYHLNVVDAAMDDADSQSIALDLLFFFFCQHGPLAITN